MEQKIKKQVKSKTSTGVVAIEPKKRIIGSEKSKSFVIGIATNYSVKMCASHSCNAK